MMRHLLHKLAKAIIILIGASVGVLLALVAVMGVHWDHRITSGFVSMAVSLGFLIGTIAAIFTINRIWRT